jgi:hypothetical protein
MPVPTTTFSAVFAFVKITGFVIANATTSQEVQDCFLGELVNEPEIIGFC